MVNFDFDDKAKDTELVPTGSILLIKVVKLVSI